MPVVDSPQRLQLHLAVDFLSFTVPPAVSQPMPHSKSEVIWLDKEVIGPVIKTVLKASEIENVEISRLKDVEGDWDLFLRVLADGSLLLSAVAVSIPRSYEMYISDQILEYRSQTTNAIEAIHNLAFASRDIVSASPKSLSLALWWEC